MLKGDKRAQFYLIATIVVAALLVALTLASNYSKRVDYYQAENIAKELRIESEKVIDYQSFHDGEGTVDELEDFSKQYSDYTEDKAEIYYIEVDEDDGIEEAYKYTAGVKVDLSSFLSVSVNEINFRLYERNYNFKLEKGKNFYFIVIYDEGGQTYVYAG
jgi:hypothetical protein